MNVPLNLFAILLLLVASAPAIAQMHWSFQPVVRLATPSSVDAEWPTGPIDSFILQRLEQVGIRPSPAAVRRTLFRRVTLDLIGLPPTIPESEEFLRDQRPDAYERVVDRLLASPHYGERWARLWLDLCHYGDTDGHLTDQLRPVAWRYRDWVIGALNANMPFDEFTISQIAGDLLGDDPRTALVSTDDPIFGTGFLRQTFSNREGGADLEEYRVEQIVDRTSMVGTIWLGLTLGCARCHDHKYDPVSHRDFFQLYSFFDQADEINIDAPLPSQRDAYLASRPQYQRLRKEALAQYQPGFDSLLKQWEERLLHAVANPGENHVWDRQWELLGLIWGGGLGEGQLEGTEIVKLAWDRRTSWQQDDLIDYFLNHGAATDEQKFAELKLGELQKRLIAIKKEIPDAMATRAPVMLVSQNPRQTYIHERGDFRSHGPDVKSNIPAWLIVHPSNAEAASANVHVNLDTKDATRLDLARWLASPGNPLTARVTVNRMWQEFFGRGIVTTSDDFGTRGAKPSHPQLLDWLASELAGSRWNTKAMHRRIVCSASYCQSSAPRPDLASTDPGNVLIARQSSLRVPAEIVRDVCLASSGLLNPALGGPGVYPIQNERVTMEAFGSNTWTGSKGGDQYRRSLYTFMQRTSPFAQSITFDAPAPARICTRRDRSNTPLQALTLLNDPAFFELSQSLAELLLRHGGTRDRDRIQFAFRQCLGRDAAPDEMDRLLNYLEQRRTTSDHENTNTATPVEWIDLSSVILNLHEFITRD